MKLGITGSRTITQFDFIPYFMMQDKDFRAFCRKHGLGRRKITQVITGGARGIDTIAFQTAASAGIRNLQFLPDRIFVAYRVSGIRRHGHGWIGWIGRKHSLCDN